MPLPINGRHQEETVLPRSETMGRENIAQNSSRPSFVRQRSNVQKVEDADDNEILLKKQKSVNGHTDTNTKSVHFADKPDHDNIAGACGSDDGIDYRPPETPDEESALTDEKQVKIRERSKKKKRKRKQWFIICSCGLFILLVASGALGFAVYSHFNPQKHSDDHGVLFCYPCHLVKPKDVITYKEEYKMCCVDKGTEIFQSSPVKVPPIKSDQTGEGKEEEKVKFQEFEIDFQRSDKAYLGLKGSSVAHKDSFCQKTDTGINIEESGLYMMTLTLTADTSNKHSAKSNRYFMFMACLKFQKGSYQDDECRKLTLLPKTGAPFEIYKTSTLEKGTVVRVTTTDVNLLDQKPSLNKLSIIQLHRS